MFVGVRRRRAGGWRDAPEWREEWLVRGRWRRHVGRLFSSRFGRRVAHGTRSSGLSRAFEKSFEAAAVLRLSLGLVYSRKYVSE